MQRTFIQKPAEVKRVWHLMDATEKVLGKLATEIAIKLIGKNKTTFTANVDGGDYVVVINANKIHVTGNKEENKKYYNHSSFPGGIRTRSLSEMRDRTPEEIIQRAVYNMIPKNKLRKDRMTRLKIYAGAEHKHQSQLEK
jgi:large subunit ribosomal protein L13